MSKKSYLEELKVPDWVGVSEKIRNLDCSFFENVNIFSLFRADLSGGLFDMNDFKERLVKVEANALKTLLVIYVANGPNFAGTMKRIETISSRNLDRETIERLKSYKSVASQIESAGMKIKTPGIAIGPNVITCSRLISVFPATAILAMIEMIPKRRWACEEITCDLFAMPPLFLAYIQWNCPNKLFLKGEKDSKEVFDIEAKLKFFSFYLDFEATKSEVGESNQAKKPKVSSSVIGHINNNERYFKVGCNSIKEDLDMLDNEIASKINERAKAKGLFCFDQMGEDHALILMGDTAINFECIINKMRWE